MLNETVRQIKTSLLLVFLFTLLTGLIYPLFITGLAKLCFTWQAEGSLIQQNGKIVGSLFIGQPFDSPNYFWGRPSATTPFPYNGESSSGSNLGPSNPDFLNTIKERAIQMQKLNNQNQHVPVDLVTSSGSGLDPEISPLAAYYQASRVAKKRGLSEDQINALIQSQINNRSFFILGEPRINVLQLNLALDALTSFHHKQKK